jgi:hypothetical protein
MMPSPAISEPRLAEARDLALGGLMGALAIALPIVFHAVGLGRAFLPMYLPILALGLLAEWPVAGAVGVAAPLLSAVLTGMPPLAPPTAVLMSAELLTLGMTASLARRWGLGVWPAAVIALVTTRAVGVAFLAVLGGAIGLQQGLREYLLASLLISWPGIALQLTIVPAAVVAIEKTSIIGYRRRGEAWSAEEVARANDEESAR